MTREEFDALIFRLESRAKAAPSAFLLRTGLLAAFGYLYMLGVLLLMICLTVAIVWLAVRVPNGLTIKLGLVGLVACGGMALAILKALWVRMSAPEGLELQRSEVPELFRLIDELRAQLNSPPFHRVLLVGDYNAAIVQIPRLGVFGWHRNYLLLGLPLMQGLGPDEFRAVLAHEFGHLSGNHGRFGNWLYRLRRTWERVFEQLLRQSPGKLAGLLTSFLKWFWPKFNAHAFVLSRANEYAADAVAAQLAGADIAASALQRVKVHAAFLDEKFWPDIFKLANSEPEPPRDLYVRSGAALRTPPNGEETARWLRTGFQLETNNADTHPCLKDRLRSFGALPQGVEKGEFPLELPPASHLSAAEAFLGAQLDSIARGLTEQWSAAIAPGWKQRHEQASGLRQQLAKLEAEAAASVAPPTPEALWDKARTLIDLEGDRAAVPVLERILSMNPSHPGACFVRGREYLTGDDGRGVDLIERAIAADPHLVPAGCELLYGHYARIGQRDQLRTLEKRVEAHQEIEALAQTERANVTASDTFLPHGLNDAQITHIREVMSSERDVAAAHVARKKVTVFPDSPCFVVGVTVKVPMWKPRSTAANQKLIGRLVERLQLPGQMLVFAKEKELKSLAGAVAKTPDSLVYQRE
jgi:Zn-dependent protease with chaperone function